MSKPTPFHASAAALQAQKAWLQGQGLARQARWQDAARHFGQAARLQPRDALYGVNLADALLKSGQPEKAAEAAGSVLALEPGHPLALALKANALLQAHRQDALVDLLESTPETQRSPELQAMLAGAQLHLGRGQDAVASYLQLLYAQPANASLHLYLGLSFKSLGLKLEAAECFRTALLLGLGAREMAVRDLLAYFEREVCDWRGGDTQVQNLRESIASLPADAAVETNPFVHATLLDNPEEQLRAVRACALHTASRLQPLPPRPARARQRLRLGYVSADFHGHATSYLMAELFERHDRSRIELFLYSHGPDDGSDIRQRVECSAEHFVEARNMASRTLAERIRADGIDVLVDLKGYTLNARPEVFAYRPAPVQVAWLGFPGTSGAPWIDYLIGDPVVTPLSHAPWFTEKIAQMPLCYQCNDGTRPLPVAPTRASQGLPDEGLVLCGFTQPYKISPAVFDVWCGLLQRLPHAVLWLLGWQSQAPQALRREAAARGIDPARLVFAPTVGQREHLDRIACADLFLDTWPCNGHTTVSDMLWAGVPVVTQMGRTFASRVAGSLLHAVGAADTVCEDVRAYEELAYQLATDVPRRRALAERLRAARQHSELFSSRIFAPHLEALIHRMWARALAGQPADHLPALCGPGSGEA